MERAAPAIKIEVATGFAGLPDSFAGHNNGLRYIEARA